MCVEEVSQNCKQEVFLPSPQVPRKSGRADRFTKRRWYFCDSGSRYRVSQIHCSTDVLVDFEVSRDECESAHVIPRTPGGGIRLRVVNRVVAHLNKRPLEHIEFIVGQFRRYFRIQFRIGVLGGCLEGFRQLLAGLGRRSLGGWYFLFLL